MQIGNHFGSYDNQIQENVKFEAAKNTGQTSSDKVANDLSNLKEGSVFKGEILSIEGDKVTIKLDSQLNLPARLQGDVNLGIGDQLLFSVKENNANQILIKPMFDSLYSAQTQVLEKALDMAGLSPTEKNFSAAKELMEAGQPLDRSTMTQLLSQSMKFPDASMNTLVSLNKMNIPVTKENIEQYMKYENYQHELTGDIKDAITGMSDFSNMFSGDVPATSVLSFATEMADMFNQDIIKETGALETELPSDVAAENQDAVLNEYAETGSAAEDETVLNNMPSIKETNSAMANETAAHQIENASKTVGAETNTDVITKDISDTLMLKTGLSGQDAGNFIRDMQQAGISNEIITNIVKNSNSPEQLLQNMLHQLSTNIPDDKSLRQLLDSKEFKNMFSDMIFKSWSINPKQMKDPKEIDDLYERIQKESKHFENALMEKGGDSKGFQQNFQNMRQNMSFMEQLNHQMIYTQMPLKLTNQNANSELYVYADKRKLMQKKDGISVMLHLDMDHLGQTDIKVDLKGSNVHARFYLNEQESVDIITDNMGELAKQLGLRGFSLTNEVVKRQPAESINKVVDEIIDENAEKSVKRYTFDART